MPNNLTAPRVPLTDPKTGLITREWYAFFLSVFKQLGGGQSATSITDLEVAPQPLDPWGVLKHLAPDSHPVSNLTLVSEALKAVQGLQKPPSLAGTSERVWELTKAVQGLQDAPAQVALVERLSELAKALQGVQEEPWQSALVERVYELTKAVQGLQMMPPVIPASPSPFVKVTVLPDTPDVNTLGVLYLLIGPPTTGHVGTQAFDGTFGLTRIF